MVSNDEIGTENQDNHHLAEDKEYNFKLNKAKELIQKLFDLFDELQSEYSLPDPVSLAVEELQEDYYDLFIGGHEATQNLMDKSGKDMYEEQKQTVSSCLDDSFNEPFPVKDDELEVSHVKHKAKIPVLDLSKVQIETDSEEEEEEHDDDDSENNKNLPPSVSSDDDPENMVQMLNEDWSSEDFKFNLESAKQIYFNSEEQEKQDEDFKMWND